MAPDHALASEIVGFGNPAIIPDLNRDGRYEMSFFEANGFRSLIAVPIFTYRVGGILGVAYRTKKRFNRDYAGLLAAVAGMLGMAYDKSSSQNNTDCVGEIHVSGAQLSVSYSDGGNHESARPAGQSEAGTNGSEKAYQQHLQRMAAFRNTHSKARKWYR